GRRAPTRPTTRAGSSPSACARSTPSSSTRSPPTSSASPPVRRHPTPRPTRSSTPSRQIARGRSTRSGARPRSRARCTRCCPRAPSTRSWPARWGSELGPGLPVAEGREQLALGLGREPVGRHLPGERHGPAHLLDVGRAVLAGGDVRLEALAVGCGERALEVVGDELDQLPAGEASGGPAVAVLAAEQSVEEIRHLRSSPPAPPAPSIAHGEAAL